MDSVAQQVRMSAGDETISKFDGAAQISQILREHFAPNAVDAVFQVARCLHFEMTDQSA